MHGNPCPKIQQYAIDSHIFCSSQLTYEHRNDRLFLHNRKCNSNRIQLTCIQILARTANDDEAYKPLFKTFFIYSITTYIII